MHKCPKANFSLVAESSPQVQSKNYNTPKLRISSFSYSILDGVRSLVPNY